MNRFICDTYWTPLIAYLERRERISELMDIIKKQRPDIAWDDVSF